MDKGRLRLLIGLFVVAAAIFAAGCSSNAPSPQPNVTQVNETNVTNITVVAVTPESSNAPAISATGYENSTGATDMATNNSSAY